jgi:hypothetical protein
MELTDHSRIVVVKDQVSCDLGGEAAILNLADGVYYGLDSVGARVWSLIKEPKTFHELRERLLAEYDVDAGRLEGDLRDLLARMMDQGLIAITP